MLASKAFPTLGRKISENNSEDKLENNRIRERHQKKA